MPFSASAVLIGSRGGKGRGFGCVWVIKGPAAALCGVLCEGAGSYALRGGGCWGFGARLIKLHLQVVAGEIGLSPRFSGYNHKTCRPCSWEIKPIEPLREARGSSLAGGASRSRPPFPSARASRRPQQNCLLAGPPSAERSLRRTVCGAVPQQELSVPQQNGLSAELRLRGPPLRAAVPQQNVRRRAAPAPPTGAGPHRTAVWG